MAVYLIQQDTYNCLFTSSITGNIVVAAASTQSKLGVISRSMTTVTFFIAALLTLLVAINNKSRKGYTLRNGSILLLIIYLVALVIVAIFGLILQHQLISARSKNSEDNPYVVIMGMLMGGAMGIQCVVGILNHLYDLHYSSHSF